MTMNVSDTVFTNASYGTDEKFKDWMYTSLSVYLSLIGIACLIGNVTVLVTFKCLRLTCKMFIVNLAASDLLMGCLAFPLSIHSNSQKRWLYGDWGCTWYGFICFSSGVSSIFSHCLIALNRYLHVCYPNNDLYFKSRQGNFVLIGLSWMLTFCFTILPVFGFGSYTFETHGSTCSLDWESSKMSSKYYIGLSFVIVLLLPSLGIVFFYCRVVKYLKSIISPTPPLNHENQDNALKMEINNRLLKILYKTMVVYFVLWTPYAAISLARSSGYEVTVEITILLTMLAKLQCAVNPVVYMGTNSQWRDQMIQFLQQSARYQTRVIRIAVTESSRDKYLEE